MKMVTLSGDMQLKKHVEDELSWEPSVNAAAIGVGVKNAIVTLSGHVSSYPEKRAAEAAVSRIHGVRALANELDVRFPADRPRTDEDIAQAAAFALAWHPSIPKDHVKIQVSHGWITLEGAVDLEYQRIAAERAVEYLMGVHGVNNLVTIKAAPVRAGVKSEIEAALKRYAAVEAQHIFVDIQGNKAILSGHVNSLVEKAAAARAAWKAPSVRWVENNIEVQPSRKTVTAA
jgi:osmotically-inducible protein OsmY